MPPFVWSTWSWRAARGAGGTHVGEVRDTNQDVIVVDPDLGLYAVFDGMGGHRAGDVAARLAATSLVASTRSRIWRPQLSPYQLFDRARRVASLDVHFAGDEHPRYRGMGTTGTACLFTSPTQLVLGHVGDSRPTAGATARSRR